MALFPVDSLITVANDDHGSQFALGDTLRILRAQDGEDKYDTVYVSQDATGRQGYIYVGGIAAAAPLGLVVGGRVRILSNGANGASVSKGDLGTITEVNDYDDGTFYVKMDSPRAEGVYTYKDGAPHWVFNRRHVEAVSGPAAVVPEVTLESFRLSFLTGAVARGEANGEHHSAQVTEALDNLARLEFLDPSADLLSFQKRIVALAMDAKGKHQWCGEPEAFLTEIGLKHLLPVRKYVKVVTEVLVSGEADWSERQFEDAASTLAAAQTNARSFWVES